MEKYTISLLQISRVFYLCLVELNENGVRLTIL